MVKVQKNKFLKNLLFQSFLLFSAFSFSQELTCTDFRIGDFYYQNSKKVIVHRTEKLQIERYEETGEELHSYIDWISDCEYVLTFKKFLDSDKKSIKKKGFLGKDLNVKIIKTEETKMTYYSVFEGIELKDEMIKILDN